MSEELSQEELVKIAKEVQQAVLAKIDEAFDEIGEERLSQALKGGLSAWTLSFEVGKSYGGKFNDFLDKLNVWKVDTSTIMLAHFCMMQAVVHMGHSHNIMQQCITGTGNKDMFGDLFGGKSSSPPPPSISNYKSFLEQGFYRIVEAESHLKNAIMLYNKEVEAAKKEVEKKEED